MSLLRFSLGYLLLSSMVFAQDGGIVLLPSPPATPSHSPWLDKDQDESYSNDMTYRRDAVNEEYEKLLGNRLDNLENLEIRLEVRTDQETGQVLMKHHLERSREAEGGRAVKGLKEFCSTESLMKELVERVSRIPVMVDIGSGSGWISPTFRVDVKPVSLMQNGDSLNSRESLPGHNGQGESSEEGGGGSEGGEGDGGCEEGGQRDIEGGSSGSSGGGGRQPRFPKKITQGVNLVTQYPTASLFSLIALLTGGLIYMEILDAIPAKHPKTDLEVATEEQQGRLLTFFGGATIFIDMTPLSFQLQLSRQNTSEYRGSEQFQAYGFTFSGKFSRAERREVRLRDYNRCPEDCVDFPDWEQCSAVVFVPEDSLIHQKGQFNLNASQIQLSGGPFSVTPDYWCPCKRCNVPTQAPATIRGSSTLNNIWTYVYAGTAVVVGLIIDYFLYRKFLYEPYFQQPLDRCLYL